MIRTHVDCVAGLVTHTGSGEISMADVEAALEARLENPSFRPGMNILWDCRSASLASLSAEQMQRLISYHNRHKAARGEGTSAIVVSRDLDYGIGRMLQAYADALPWQTMVFRDLEDAMQQLSRPA